MNFTSKTELINYLLHLIANEGTGNTKQLCERLCISQRTLFRYLEELRIMGHPISYCRQQQTYYLIK
jgi:predicted DNA-binding transcriptional regulator YafY